MYDRRRFFRKCGGLAAAGVAATALPAPAQGTVTEGIDVSHWQGVINWPNVAAGGIKFAICKATEGLTFVDPKFSTNWPAIKANGMVRGAYHMGRTHEDPIKQVRLFYDVVKPTSGDLPLVLDLERNDGMTTTQVRYWTQRFLLELKRRIGRPPLIYTGFYYWRDSAGNSPNNYDSLLWMPRWHDNDGTPGAGGPYPLPGAWSNWTFWQYTSTGSVPGISGNVDRDQFNGSVSALQALGLP